MKDDAVKLAMYVVSGRLMLVGSGVKKTSPRDAHVLQLTVSLSGEPFLIKDDKGEWLTQSVLVPPDYKHQIVSGDVPCGCILIQPEDKQALDLIHQYFKDGKQLYLLSYYQDCLIRNQLKSCLAELASLEVVSRCINQCLSILADVQLAPLKAPVSIRDSRVEHCLQLIHQVQSSELTVRSVTSRIGISPSRMRALFKAEIGISLRRYLLWHKLLRATQACLNDTPISEAIFDAGFFDIAHFSRTYKSMFGINWSQLVRRNDLLFMAEPSSDFLGIKINTSMLANQ